MVDRFVQQICKILRHPNDAEKLGKLIAFNNKSANYMRQNCKQLGDSLAATNIFPVLRQVVEHLAGKTPDVQGMVAACCLYSVLLRLTIKSITMRVALCEARIPEHVAKHMNMLYWNHRQDKVGTYIDLMYNKKVSYPYIVIH